MREETVRKHKIISGINTAIICILLLLLFWFYNLEYEVEPLIREAQVEVELLPSGGGGGSSSSSSEEKTTVPKMSLPAKSTEQTNDKDAVAAKKTSKTPSNSDNTNPDDFNPATGYKKSSTGQNQDNGPNFGGNGTGSTNGTGNGPNNGPGDGTGLQHSFGTRRLNPPKIKHNCGRRGKVICHVSVKANGDIVLIGIDPGSTQDNCLASQAERLIGLSKFESISGDKSVTGYITINFELN